MNDRNELDLADPYDNHAFFICGFDCDDCGAEVVRDRGFEGCDDPGCRHIAEKARAAGWYVPLDLLQACYCPACAKRRGLK